MNEPNTVTIPVDEYFEMRQKAEMNMSFVREMGAFQLKLDELYRKVETMDYEIKRLKAANEYDRT